MDAAQSTREPAVPEKKGLFVLYLLGAITMLCTGYFFRADLVKALTKLEAVIGLLGPAAPLCMAVICGIWGAFCLPGPLMQGTVGTLFATEPHVALAVVMAGETIALTIAFTIGRSLGREKVRRKMEGKPWFVKLEQETEKKGFLGVAVFRMMPFFPNALASYAFGLTNLRFLTYVTASVLGSFPKMVLYIYGTTSIVSLFRAGALSSTSIVTVLAVMGLLAGLGRALQVRLRRQAQL